MLFHGLPPFAHRRTNTLSRQGASSVEFAVVSLVFFTMFLGLVELGRGLMVSYALTNAARQGARAGIPDGSTTSVVTTATNSALSRAGVNGATVTVQVNGTSSDVSTAKTGDKITVSVTVQASKVSWLPGTRYIVGNLTGSYALTHE